MAKQISQETFDAVVKENIEEFDMEAEEALNDAIQQFEAQVLYSAIQLHSIIISTSFPLDQARGPSTSKLLVSWVPQYFWYES